VSDGLSDTTVPIPTRIASCIARNACVMTRDDFEDKRMGLPRFPDISASSEDAYVSVVRGRSGGDDDDSATMGTRKEYVCCVAMSSVPPSVVWLLILRMFAPVVMVIFVGYIPQNGWK
jgi:hypothetical protein